VLCRNYKGYCGAAGCNLDDGGEPRLREALFGQWRRRSSVSEQVVKRIRRTVKANMIRRRMEGLTNIQEAGTSGEFHAAAANIYERLARFKDSRTPPTLEEILAALTGSNG
jgi:hypothetical protein